MIHLYKKLFAFAIISILLVGCASKRKKKGGEPSKLSKFYHNTTALYNGYFNANELMKKSYLTLQTSHQDNYNEILPLYDYVAVADPKIVAADLDKAIEKVTTVSALHEPSKWVDDCYVLMGEAQYLKQDYESAEETFAYFKNEFNPNNPFGRNYKKKKKSRKAIKKEQAKEREAEKKAKEEKKKADKKAKDEEKKAREEAKKAADEARKKERERKKKEREEEQKRKKKNRKKKRGGDRKKREEVKETKVENETTTTKKETTTPTPEKVAPKEDEKKEEEEEYTPPKKEEKKIDKTAYPMGMIWYARTLVKREKYANASYLVKRMRDEGGVKDDVLREVPVILADIAIKEKNNAQAVDFLDEAIELSDSKSKKARYAFVQGQLHLRAENYGAAGEAFSNAKKWAKDFDMEFMAEMNMEKSQMLSGGKSKEKIIAKLDKMSKEDKYSEYRDQIYYTKGEILLADGQFDEALSSFSKSIANNVANIPLKQETYYKLAKLFYDKEEYVSASSYYDSTVQVLTKDDPRFLEASNYAENLTDIAKNINTIETQDSLLGMVAWDDDKIEKLAERLLEEQKNDATKGAVAESSGRKSTALLNGNKGGFKTSTFFAYDPVSKQRGQREFEDKWGDIPLEDNWRRQDKSGVFAGDEDESDDEKVAEDGFEEDEISKIINGIKSQIPYSDEAKKSINDKLELAFFELGKDYRDKIQNFEKAAETHEELLRRFPETDKKLDTYYYLYLTYLDIGNSTQASKYKNKILSDFPDTEYAKAISDPNWAANNLSAEQKIEKHYEDTYAAFEAGDYQTAYTKAKQADQVFGKENPLKAKFALIKAMSTGSIEGKAAYVKALRDVITRYPNTPEKARADEILRFLQGDDDAFAEVAIEEVDDLFSLEDDKLHYIAVVLYETTADKMVNAKISVSNYNKEFHKLKKLQLQDATLNRDKKSEVILVRRFENKEKAMAYYNEVIKSKEQFISNEIGSYTIYPISQRNYRKMIIEASDHRYRVFFKKHYLGE